MYFPWGRRFGAPAAACSGRSPASFRILRCPTFSDAHASLLGVVQLLSRTRVNAPDYGLPLETRPLQKRNNQRPNLMNARRQARVGVHPRGLQKLASILRTASYETIIQGFYVYERADDAAVSRHNSHVTAHCCARCCGRKNRAPRGALPALWEQCSHSPCGTRSRAAAAADAADAHRI